MESPIAPSIGRIVLFDEGDGVERPAIIMRVHSNNCINVMLFRDGEGAYPRSSVVYEEQPNTNTTRWYWMDYQKKVAGV